MKAAEPTTILDAIAGHARENPTGTAVILSGRSLSWRHVWEGSGKFASFLLDRGIGRGDRVLIALPNSGEFFSAFYGVQRAGAIPVPTYPDAGRERILSMYRLCRASAAVLPPETGAAGGDHTVVAVKDSASCLLKDSLPGVGPDDTAFIQYTSGTTGRSKGVQIYHRHLMSNIHQLMAGMAITERDVFLSWLPVCHDMGLVLMTMVPFYLGTTLVLQPASLSSIRNWMGIAERYRATITASPDFGYRLCVSYTKDPGRLDLSSLRVALNAAETVRPSTIRSFERTFRLSNVMIAGYGLAEATVGVSTWIPGRPMKVDSRGFVSAGPPFPGAEVRIVSRGRAVRAGEEGEIEVKSPSVTAGYYRNKRQTERLFRKDGFIRTGDLGYLDDDGHLFIVGRRKEIIIHGGRNLSPGEVEEVADRFSFVRRSAAVGIDSGTRAGEQVFVFAEVRRESLSGRDFRKMSAELVNGFLGHFGFRPGKICLLKPGSLPLTRNGKMRYRELRRRYLEGVMRREGHLLFPMR